jgi:hypothetical protein
VKTIEIIVSDPWEFGTEHGVGPFQCELLSMEGKGGPAYAQLADPITIHKISCRYVEVSPRLACDSLQDVFKGREVGANFVFGKDEDAVRSPWNSSKAPFGAIGSVRMRSRVR